MSFKLDTSGVKSLVDFTGQFEEATARAEFRAVNKVAEKTSTRSKREIVSIVNLSASYVRERMSLQKAQLYKPVAFIKGRTRPTRLITYAARQLTASAPKAKGNARVGIPAGRKAAGVSVGVTRKNGRKTMASAFLMPLKNDNGLGIFTRTGGKLKHHYGPSVDQTFTLVIENIRDDVGADLEDTLAKQLDYELRNIR